MLSHGIISAGLFLCVGVIYDRIHTREIAAYGGLVQRMPIYAVFFMVLTMGNVGLPGTSGFIGEFLTLLASFKVNTWVAFFATSGVIFSAAYALYAYRRVIYGALVKPALKNIEDVTPREIATLAPLVALTIFFGFYPSPILDVTAVSVKKLVTTYEAAVGVKPATATPAPAAPPASPAPAPAHK
jgi:NADH-quinone oxidoreductase subunit M